MRPMRVSNRTLALALSVSSIPFLMVLFAVALGLLLSIYGLFYSHFDYRNWIILTLWTILLLYPVWFLLVFIGSVLGSIVIYIIVMRRFPQN